MKSSTIAEAIQIFSDMVNVLDKAYWEANSLNTKDTIYDCISAINHEQSELNKLSIQDHDLPYEPISSEFKIASQRFPQFRNKLDNQITRSSTLAKLDQATSSIMKLITPDTDIEEV